MRFALGAVATFGGRGCGPAHTNRSTGRFGARLRTSMPSAAASVHEQIAASRCTAVVTVARGMSVVECKRALSQTFVKNEEGTWDDISGRSEPS